MANENDMEWFTPGKSCKKCDTKPFSGFELLHFYESVFPLIRESISEAIRRKLSNRDYKMENTGIETNAILKYMKIIYRCNACRYKPETNRNIAIFPSKIH
jgi:hypothetical protein